MRIKYRTYVRRGAEEFGKMPILHVLLRHGKETVNLDCLVDSGAGECVFNIDIADALNLDLSSAPTKYYEAVGGSTLIARIHPIKLQIVGFNEEWITINAGFISDDEIPLLGHSGFFEHYEITFRSYRNQFEIGKKRIVRHPSPNP